MEKATSEDLSEYVDFVYLIDPSCRRYKLHKRAACELSGSGYAFSMVARPLQWREREFHYVGKLYPKSSRSLTQEDLRRAKVRGSSAGGCVDGWLYAKRSRRKPDRICRRVFEAFAGT